MHERLKILLLIPGNNTFKQLIIDSLESMDAYEIDLDVADNYLKLFFYSKHNEQKYDIVIIHSDLINKLDKFPELKKNRTITINSLSDKIDSDFIKKDNSYINIKKNIKLNYPILTRSHISEFMSLYLNSTKNKELSAYFKLNKDYDFKSLLLAFNELENKKDIKLKLFVNVDEYSDELQKLRILITKLNIKRFIELKIVNELTPEIFKNSRIYISTNISNNLSYDILLACCSGCYVIGCEKNEFNRSILKYNGIGKSVESSDFFALAKIIKESLRKTFYPLNQRKSALEFSDLKWERTIEKVISSKNYESNDKSNAEQIHQDEKKNNNSIKIG